MAELMQDQPSRWHRELNLAMADAIYFTASDLSERFEYQPGNEDVERILTAERRTILRLNGIAQRLSESGNAAAAARLDAQAELLQFQQAASYVPRLSPWGNEYADTVIMIGESPLRTLRREFAWLTAELRERKIRVDRDGDPIGVEPLSGAEYRWGLLFSVSDDPRTAWDDRFKDDSWFRRLTKLTSDGLSDTKLGRLAQP